MRGTSNGWRSWPGTTDGFTIAEEDLRLRREGEFAGTAQAGAGLGTIGNIVADFELYMRAKVEADAIVGADPELRAPEHRASARARRQRRGRARLAGDVVTGAAAACAVGFDFDHTLGLDNGLEATAYYRLAAELGRSVSERDRAWTAFIDDTLLERFRAGAISLDDAIDAFVERLGLAPQPAYVEALSRASATTSSTTSSPRSTERANSWQTLAERAIPTAILTNGWSPLQYRKIGRALGYAGPILVSDELGIVKPDPAAFGKLVDVLGVPRERVWFVGDNPKTDVAGAQGAGLRAVWFDWEHIAYPADAPRPDVRIARLSELPALLPGPDVRAENVGR